MIRQKKYPAPLMAYEPILDLTDRHDAVLGWLHRQGPGAGLKASQVHEVLRAEKNLRCRERNKNFMGASMVKRLVRMGLLAEDPGNPRHFVLTYLGEERAASILARA